MSTTPGHIDDADVFHLTDVGNAQRLVQRHGDDLLYCYPWGKWLVWDGKRYAIDNSGEVECRAKAVALSLYEEAARETDRDERKEVARWASQTESYKRIAAMLAMARSEPQIPILPEKLDADPWKLNVSNGVIDLKDGSRLAHDRGYMMTRLCPSGYIRTGGPGCPLWLSFLDRIFAGNDGLIEFVQRLFGYGLIGTVYEHVLAVLHGRGSNGKSVLVETLLGVLGTDYAVKGSSELLLAKRGSEHPTERCDLFGKRLVVCCETDDGRRFAEATVKELTGGDTIKARRMREDYWQFKPSHLVALVTNHKPTIKGTDEGIWRRVKLIPFSVQIPKAEQDEKLTEKLLAERAGILHWLVQGCLAWQTDRLGEPPEVQQATANYRNDEDVLGQFIAERCELNDVLNVKAADLYAAYVDWAKRAGEYTLSQRKFGKAMTERDFERYTNAGVWYRGIGLNGEF